MGKKGSFMKKEKPFGKKGVSPVVASSEVIDETSGLSVGLSAEKVSGEFKPGEARKPGVPVTDERWYPGKRELTVKEQQQRDRDCKVEYSGVVPTSLQKALDTARRENWVPPSEVEKMPMWTPTLTPLVGRVLDESVKEVAQFMDEPAKEDREKIVAKLKAKVLKLDKTRDPELVEKRIWAMLFDLQKEQGVEVKSKLFK